MWDEHCAIPNINAIFGVGSKAAELNGSISAVFSGLGGSGWGSSCSKPLGSLFPGLTCAGRSVGDPSSSPLQLGGSEPWLAFTRLLQSSYRCLKPGSQKGLLVRSLLLFSSALAPVIAALAEHGSAMACGSVCSLSHHAGGRASSMDQSPPGMLPYSQSKQQPSQVAAYRHRGDGLPVPTCGSPGWLFRKLLAEALRMTEFRCWTGFSSCGFPSCALLLHLFNHV